MSEQTPRPRSLTPIYDQLLQEQEQHPPCPDPPTDDTGPDQPAEPSPSPPPS